MTKKGHALVTGASGGLGREIALELARLGYPTLLVSSTGKIHSVSEEISEKYGLESKSFVVDLSSEEATMAFARKMANEYEVCILVNNVGLGGSGEFQRTPVEHIAKILRLNVFCTALLTRELLPNLLRNTPSRILNISSMAALTPTAYKTVYPASKAFVNAFSYGLREELRGSGVSVSVAVPGAMATNPEIRGRIEKQGALGRATLKPTDEIARKFVKGMMKGRRTISVNPLGFFLSKAVPGRLRTYILSKIVRRETL